MNLAILISRCGNFSVNVLDDEFDAEGKTLVSYVLPQDSHDEGLRLVSDYLNSIVDSYGSASTFLIIFDSSEFNLLDLASLGMFFVDGLEIKRGERFQFSVKAGEKCTTLFFEIENCTDFRARAPFPNQRATASSFWYEFSLN